MHDRTYICMRACTVHVYGGVIIKTRVCMHARTRYASVDTKTTYMLSLRRVCIHAVMDACTHVSMLAFLHG